MILSIASGKGGTGKTTLAVNMAVSVGSSIQVIDCDVEEPNVHLLLRPKIVDERPVYRPVPLVNEEVCNHCGKCALFCPYKALFVTFTEVLVFYELCRGCGGCALVCPKGAISEGEYTIGTLKRGFSNGIEVIYGVLKVREPMAAPLIRNVKKYIDRTKDVIIDAPPGASCPMVEAVKGSDYCILVTEPTPFGLHDLKIAVCVLRRMNIPFGVVINRANIGDRGVYDYCKENGIPILLEIPYQRRIAELYSRGVPFSLEMPEWRERLRSLYNYVRRFIDNEANNNPKR